MSVTGYRGDSLRVSANDWLNVLESDYLLDFIPSGGSVVKFVSGLPETIEPTKSSISSMAARLGYFHVGLDPGECGADGKKPDLHQIDKFFFAVTRDVCWKECASAQVRNYLDKQGIRLPPGGRLDDLDAIAIYNNRDRADLLSQFQSHYATPLVRDKSQEIEFRTAYTALSRAQIAPDSVTPSTEDVVLGWFAGRAGISKELKKLHIFSRITVSNARFMLASFCRWVPRTGRTGVIITLDFRPYERIQRSAAKRKDETLEEIGRAIERGASVDEIARIHAGFGTAQGTSYTPLAYHKILQLLRRFIDEIELFERLCLIVLTSPAYYEPSSERNYFNYDALQTRIGLEVHDSTRANLLAALVHLEEGR